MRSKNCKHLRCRLMITTDIYSVCFPSLKQRHWALIRPEFSTQLTGLFAAILWKINTSVAMTQPYPKPLMHFHLQRDFTVKKAGFSQRWVGATVQWVLDYRNHVKEFASLCPLWLWTLLPSQTGGVSPIIWDFKLIALFLWASHASV